MNKMPNDAHNITHEKIYTEAYFIQFVSVQVALQNNQ